MTTEDVREEEEEAVEEEEEADEGQAEEEEKEEEGKEEEENEEDGGLLFMEYRPLISFKYNTNINQVASFESNRTVDCKWIVALSVFEYFHRIVWNWRMERIVSLVPRVVTDNLPQLIVKSVAMANGAPIHADS